MTARPIVIAHRGASGYLPEHTLVGKALAYGLGADYLEQDVVATRDRELVVLHDLHLDDVTNVATKFPARRRDDGHFYVIDFDLAELRQLDVSERRLPGSESPRFPGRFPHGLLAGLRIATLDEELELIDGLNRSMHRRVGIYPEIKAPSWHRRHGVDLARLLIEKLDAHGYRSAADPVFVQCFDATELARVRRELGSSLRLIQLVGPEAEYAELLTPSGLGRVADYAQGLGPFYEQLLAPPAADFGSTLAPGPLGATAHAAGLELHPYTFRADQLPPYASSIEDLLSFFFERIGVDGVFCDQPDRAVRVRDAVSARGCNA